MIQKKNNTIFRKVLFINKQGQFLVLKSFRSKTSTRFFIFG